MIIVELSFKQQAKIPAILLEMILFNDNFKEQAKKCCICFFFIYLFLLYSVLKCLTCSVELSLSIDTEMSRLTPSESLNMSLLCPHCNKTSCSIAILKTVNKGNNKITELRTILQRESQNS